MAILKDLIVLGASRISDALYASTIYEGGTALSAKYAAINHTHSNYLTSQDHYKTSLTAQTTSAVYPITINANGHIASYGTAVTSMPASDVYAWAKAATKPSYTKSEIGLGNVDNTADANKSVNYATSAGSAGSVSRATFGNSDNGEHNANNIASNGLWYYNSNGPATTLGASTTDGALYSQAYSTSWVGQIAQDYRNGRLFVRGKNNGTWQSWLAVLDSGNYTSYVNTTNFPGLNSTGTVTSVKVGTTSYSPSSGVISLPAYPTVPTNVSAFTNDAGYTTNTGTVTSVKVGSTSYSPSSGVVSLPAYPSDYYSANTSRTANTVLAAPNGSSGVASFRALVAADIPSITKSKISDFPSSMPASDVYRWAKASTKPSYSWSEITGKPTVLSNYDFSYGGEQDVTTSSVTVTFAANTRGTKHIIVGNDLAITFAVNNQAENYLWITNNNSAEIDITVAGISNSTLGTIAYVYMPEDGISIPGDRTCEIGIVVTSDFKAFITCRSDLDYSMIY